MTVGPLMKAWGFFRGEGRLPTERAGRARAARSACRHVHLDRRSETIRFDAEGVELDLGGIAKGYAVDRAVDCSRRERRRCGAGQRRREHALRAGRAAGSHAWDVEDPGSARRARRGVRGSAEGSRALDLRQLGEIVRARRRPLLPHHGPAHRPAGPGVLSVVVLAATGTAGDALDNALFVQGVERGRASCAGIATTEAFSCCRTHGEDRTKGGGSRRSEARKLGSFGLRRSESREARR